MATMEDMTKEVERARWAEQWAKDRAEYWLIAVRQMHGKLAMLKAEVRKLRSRTNDQVELLPKGGSESKKGVVGG